MRPLTKAALLVIMGVLIMTGVMVSWSSMLASAAAEEETADLTAPDFALQDQYGNKSSAPMIKIRNKAIVRNSKFQFLLQGVEITF